jgi:hypothetical protein
MMISRSSVFLSALFFLSALSPAAAFIHKTAPFVASTALDAATTDVTAIMTEVKVGDAFPSVEVKELVTGAERPVPLNIAELVSDKKVAIFGVPGAFTPGCSKSHLPSFMDAEADLKAKGVDMVLCIATNDAYVMEVRLSLSTVRRRESINPACCWSQLILVHEISLYAPHTRPGVAHRVVPTRESASLRTTLER